MRMLEESLTRLQTDHLDVWRVHEVVYYNDPEKCYAPDGVLEALTAAKQQGKVRFVGFTGHKNPLIHLDMLNRGFAFDTVQFPVNPFDPSFRSFEKNVLPVAVAKKMAVLREHGRQFDDGRYELFKSTIMYDGDVGRQQHDYPTPAELPA